MAYYVVRSSQADDSSLTGRPSAEEAIRAMKAAIEQGWNIEEITRDRRVIDEAVLRHDADGEASFASFDER